MTNLKKLEAEGSDSDKVESIRFDLLVYPYNSATRFFKEFFFLRMEAQRWLMGYCDLELLMPLKELSDRTKILRTMLKVFFIPPTISRSSTKLVDNSHPTTKLVVALNVNHEEHLLRALADTGASSSITLKTYTPKDIIIS
jgi:hypothetical protein